MNKSDFQKMQTMVEKQTYIDETNILGKSHEIHTLYQYYLRILTNEMSVLDDLEQKKLTKYGSLFEYYKFNHSYRYETKSEIESQIFADPNYQQISRQYDEQKCVVIYLEKTLENIKNMSFSIKNFMEVKRFYAGE